MRSAFVPLPTFSKVFVSKIDLTAPFANRRPRPLARTRFLRSFHKEVECQQRKNPESCDAFRPLASSGDESEGEEFVPARVSCSRRRILSPEVSFDSSPLWAKRHRCQIDLRFPVSLVEVRRVNGLPNRRRRISPSAQSRATTRSVAPKPCGQSWPGMTEAKGYLSCAWLSMITQHGKFGWVWLPPSIRSIV